MWCISGIPGSGKSTICRLLDEKGISCRNALEFQGSSECVQEGEVDTQCLKFIIAGQKDSIAVESHFSHLLGCSSVIILERSEEGTRNELENRGYSEAKISENIDALRADVIYSEALEILPAGKIHRVQVEENKIEDALVKCMKLIVESKNKD